MIILGVDPGIRGALAALFCEDADGPEFVADVFDIPSIEDGSRNEVDVVKLAKWVHGVHPDFAVVENVQPMPSIPGANGERRTMGAATSFRFGLVVGQIRATLTCYGIPIKLVHPQTWKAFYELRGSNKDDSRLYAANLYPEAADKWLTRKKDDGRGEAILMARWGERMYRRGKLVL